MTITDPTPSVLGSPVEASPAPAAVPEPSPEPRSGSGPGRARRALLALVWTAVGMAGLLALWWAAASQSPDLPGPAKGLSALRDLLADPFYDRGPNDKGIGVQLWLSLQRVFKGFVLAAAVGIPLGCAIGGSKRAWQAVNPIVQLLRPVSPLAWFPIGLVALKDITGASIFVIFITALWPTVLNTAAGAASVPRDQRNVARVFHFGRFAYLRHVVLPHTLPSIVTGLRLSMGIAWMVIVAVEMLAGSTGIGGFVWIAYNGSDLPAVMAAILLIGGVGLFLDFVFLRAHRRVALEEVAH